MRTHPATLPATAGAPDPAAHQPLDLDDFTVSWPVARLAEYFDRLDEMFRAEYGGKQDSIN